MRLIIIFILLLCYINIRSVFAEIIVGGDALNVHLHNSGDGVEITEIKSGNIELFNSDASGELFSLRIDNTVLNSGSGWDRVSVTNDGTNCRIILQYFPKSLIPDSITAVIDLFVSGTVSRWSFSAAGLENSTIKEIAFPRFNIRSGGSDYFLIPHYSGKLLKNFAAGEDSIILKYPTGWDATMQFSAYYNDDYGIYLGTHDPKASLKRFVVKSQDGGILYKNIFPAADKGNAGNDWRYPGYFQLEIFRGNWYEASQIYRKWVLNEAEFRPPESEKRAVRQHIIGNMGIWAYYADQESDYNLRRTFTKYAEYMGVPVGFHWYEWNNKEFDTDYPDYFPERPEMDKLVNDLKKNSNIYLMPYINGRLYDTSLSNYLSDGYPYAAKDRNGNIFSQDFNGNHFAVMCPTQTDWQNILADASEQLTERIGTDAVYLDQVCAAGAVECMDTVHHHKLGGGHWWRDGYKEMFEKIHNTVPDSIFITVEGACDYLADEVDGFLVAGWTTDNLVPAFQAVYSGKVQLFGTSTSTRNYHNEAFYCKLSQAFINGIQPGRTSAWIVSDSNADIAAPFVRQLARMRYKLKDFLSFGKMLKPLGITGEFPNITTTWYDYGNPVEVTISALQTSFWENSASDKTAVLFANASMDETLIFDFEFNGERNGISGDLVVREITENDDGTIRVENNSFVRSLSLKPLEVKALIIASDTTTFIEENNGLTVFHLDQNYPNPFNPITAIRFSIPETSHAKMVIYNILGKTVKVVLDKKVRAGSYLIQFDGSSLPSGIYFYRLDSGAFTKVRKMMLLK